MTEFVRVKDATTGAESTVPKRFADAYKLEILSDKAAVDANGRPLAAKTVPPELRVKDAEASDSGSDGGNTPPASEPMTPPSDNKSKGGTAK